MLRDVGRAGAAGRGRRVVPVRGPAGPGDRQGEPGLDRLRGRRRTVGQGLRPRGQRHERRAGKEPGLRPVCQSDGQAEVPGRWQADDPAAGAEPKFGPIADRNKSVPRLGFADDGRSGCSCGTTPCPAGRARSGSARPWRSTARPGRRPRGWPFGQPDRQPPGPRGRRQRHAGRLQRRLPAERQQSRRRRPLRRSPVVRDGTERPARASSTTRQPPSRRSRRSTPTRRPTSARSASYRVTVGGKTLRPLRGEFHRHTEISSHNDQDGLLEDAWRYALDAADHDWMGNGDHDNGFGYEYLWWLIQKTADLHLNPPRFVAAQTYERSVVYPNGHRNVIMPRRGIRPLPRGDLPGTPEDGTPDTKLLYAYLKHFGGICARTPRPPTWAPTGATTTPRSSRSWRSTRATATTTSTSGAQVAHRGDADRRLRAQGLRLERPREGLPARLREQQRPRQHPPELRHRLRRGHLAPGAHRGLQEAALLRGDRQHPARRPLGRPHDGRRLRHQGKAGASRSSSRGPAPVAKVHVIRDNRYV